MNTFVYESWNTIYFFCETIMGLHEGKKGIANYSQKPFGNFAKKKAVFEHFDTSLFF
jgi:hypothetical protein